MRYRKDKVHTNKNGTNIIRFLWSRWTMYFCRQRRVNPLNIVEIPKKLQITILTFKGKWRGKMLNWWTKFFFLTLLINCYILYKISIYRDYIKIWRILSFRIFSGTFLTYLKKTWLDSKVIWIMKQLKLWRKSIQVSLTSQENRL